MIPIKYNSTADWIEQSGIRIVCENGTCLYVARDFFKSSGIAFEGGTGRGCNMVDSSQKKLVRIKDHNTNQEMLVLTPYGVMQLYNHYKKIEVDGISIVSLSNISNVNSVLIPEKNRIQNNAKVKKIP